MKKEHQNVGFVRIRVKSAKEHQPRAQYVSLIKIENYLEINVIAYQDFSKMKIQFAKVLLYFNYKNVILDVKLALMQERNVLHATLLTTFD